MRLVGALAIVYVVWGSTYLAIAVAERTLPPLLMLSARFLLAGAVLYSWLWRRDDVAAARPGRRQWAAAAVVGFALLVLDTGGVAWAEQRVASGIAALLVASVPLFMAVLDRAFFGIRLPLGAAAGIATGLLGVGLLAGPSGRVDAVGAIGRVHPGAVSGTSLAAFAYLVVFGSLVAFTAYGWLLKRASTPLLSTYAYANPGVAVFLGWAFAGEHVGGREIAAGLVILSSVGMLMSARAPKEETPAIPESLPGYIRAKDAQSEELREVPRLAELHRIVA